LIDLDQEFFEIQRAVAHLDLGLKAYRAATQDQIDASRLLESIKTELDKLVESAQAARDKVHSSLSEPIKAEG